MTIGKRHDDIVRAARDVIAGRGFHQASIREIARSAHLSLAGLYHYVAGKDELLFLVIDRALDRLLTDLDDAIAHARTPEQRLVALVATHLEFAFSDAAALTVINRDWELVSADRRRDIVARRAKYLQRGVTVLRDIDPHRRAEDELYAATTLLLGMLNGIATRPFVRAAADVAALAADVSALFLYGFLEPSPERAVAVTVGGSHP